MEQKGENANGQGTELADEALEDVAGGVQGNQEMPTGHKRVCAHCGSENVHYSVSAGGFPVCFACGSTEYNFVPE